MKVLDASALKRWRADPVAFVRDVLRDPETGEPFKLYAAERTFLRKAFKVGKDGRLRYPEAVYSGPKKSGKSTLGAMIMLYMVIILGGRFAEGYAVANDLEQAQGRVFQACRRIVEASPLLKDEAKITVSKIEFDATGATITALAADFAGAAGANPTITVFDELWAYTTERAHRLWDEMVPVPTRRVSCRLTVTYAGFEGESDLLEALHKRGLKGEPLDQDLYVQPGMLMFWTHECPAPWQTPEWREQMREQLRPNAFLRMIENHWVSSESSFVEPEWWDACVDPGACPVVADRELSVWCGVDASTKRDSTAIAACTWDQDARKARLVWHRIFQPSPKDPLDFEQTVEETLLNLKDRFRLREVRFDPYQMAAVSQRLVKSNVPMIEFAQTVPNLTAASTNLYELIKGRGLVVYPDDEIRLAINRAVAIETSRGWRITKEKASHKIDIVVALAMAALGAVQKGQARPSTDFDLGAANEGLRHRSHWRMGA
ncbi:MAG: terminase large subunit [Alphaproteobacteria bacterium]